jgi:16S rRNA (uracil1498-N3)-methyltransferase
MRLKEGDEILSFDGEGKEYFGIIKTAKKTEVIVEITKAREQREEDIAKITLAVAIPKKAKIDFIIEKATELGISAIIPLSSRRTVVKIDKEKKDSKLTRWQKIALSASKQCGRPKVPVIYPVTEFRRAAEKIAECDLGIMACLTQGTEDIKSVIRGFKGRSIIVFIGPEGDFTGEEIELARSKGAKLVSLGPRVLKVDTASLAVLSILHYELGENV